MSNFNIGDIATLTMTFSDTVTGVPTDPTTVSVVIWAPDGTSVTYTYAAGEVDQVSTGVYTFDLPLLQSGVYAFRWIGAGVLEAVEEGEVTVQQTVLAGTRPNRLDLCTIDQVKEYLQIALDNSTYDLLLSRLVTAVSTYWLRRTGHTNADGSVPAKSTFVEQVAFDEWYDGNGNDRLFLRQTPIASVQLLEVNGKHVDPSPGFKVPGYLIDRNGKCLVLRGGSRPMHGYGIGSNYLWGVGSVGAFFNGTQNVHVQYTAGFASTPYDVVEAAVELVALIFSRRKWVGLDQNAVPDVLGTMIYSKWELPPSVATVLNYYSRVPMA